jgi:hypothetical protein
MGTLHRICCIVACAASVAVGQPDSAADTVDVSNLPWLTVGTITGGWLRNTTRFLIKVPQGSSGAVEYEEHEAALTDDGLGFGLTAVGFYKRIAFTSVNFLFPDVNQSLVGGTITTVSGTIPTGTRFEPYLGSGIIYTNTDTEYRDFTYSLEQALYGRPAIGYATFPAMDIDVAVWALTPRVGLRIALPIQHWYITPYYCYMLEWVESHARSPGGHVEVYYKGDREQGLPPQLEVDVPAFNTRSYKDYGAHMVGTHFFLDFHYFLQLRGQMYYNISYRLFTCRFTGTVLLNRYIGLTAYVEYSQKQTVTNTYVLVGPSFLLGPRRYLEKFKRRRDEE